MDNKTHTIGQKIKRLRKREKLSQAQLLERINTDGEAKGDSAWICRIEHGKISPSKETICKILQALNLKVIHFFSFLNLNTSKLVKFLNTTKSFSFCNDLDEVCQNSVNEIAYELDLLAAAIFLVDEIDNNKLYSKTFTKTWFSEQYYKLLPQSFQDYSILLNKHSDNLIAKTINEKKCFHTVTMEEATVHAYSPELSSILKKLIGFKSGVTVPIIYDEKAIGAIFYMKNFVCNFEIELPVLKAFTDHVAAAIFDAKKYAVLKNEIQKLKNVQTDQRK